MYSEDSHVIFMHIVILIIGIVLCLAAGIPSVALFILILMMPVLVRDHLKEEDAEAGTKPVQPLELPSFTRLAESNNPSKTSVSRKTEEEKEEEIFKTGQEKNRIFENMKEEMAVGGNQSEAFFQAHSDELTMADYRQMRESMIKWCDNNGDMESIEQADKLGFFCEAEECDYHDGSLYFQSALFLEKVKENEDGGIENGQWSAGYPTKAICTIIPCIRVCLLDFHEGYSRWIWQMETFDKQEMLLERPYGLKGIWKLTTFKSSSHW